MILTLNAWDEPFYLQENNLKKKEEKSKRTLFKEIIIEQTRLMRFYVRKK